MNVKDLHRLIHIIKLSDGSRTIRAAFFSEIADLTYLLYERKMTCKDINKSIFLMLGLFLLGMCGIKLIFKQLGI